MSTEWDTYKMTRPNPYKPNKSPIRAFFTHYNDEKLAALLAHAQSGKLSYSSCCCFVGSATSDHALQSRQLPGQMLCLRTMVSASDGTPDVFYTALRPAVQHLLDARSLPGAVEAEQAFFDLAVSKAACGDHDQNDALRRRRLIPMIKAEMKRREKLSKEIEFQQAMRTLREEETCAVL